MTATAQVPKKLRDYLKEDDFLTALRSILPKHLTPERVVALVILQQTKAPLLAECDPKTVLRAVMEASKLGLEIGRTAHLVPFKNRRRGVYECQMIPDYRGLIQLVVQARSAQHIDARVVYDGDVFAVQLGSEPRITHLPALDGDRSPEAIKAFYAVAHLASGLTVFPDPMTRDEVDAIRDRSRAKDDGPWVTDYVAMGKKTVVKQLCKFLPQTPEIAAAIELDNRAETGEIGHVNELIDSSDSVNAAVAEETQDRVEALKQRLGAGTKDSTPGGVSPRSGSEG